MIREGFEHLDASRESPVLTRYHFEAGIACMHARAKHWLETDWAQISRLYELLNAHAPSSATKVNWAVSLIMEDALDDAQALLDEVGAEKVAVNFTGWHLAQQKLADARGDAAGAKAALEQARTCMNSDAVDQYLAQQWQLYADGA